MVALLLSVFALLAGDAWSAPAPAPATGDFKWMQTTVNSSAMTGRFSLQEVPNEGYQGVDAPTSLLLAYEKYANKLPPALAKAVEVNPNLARFKSLLYSEADSQKASVRNYPTKFYDTQYVLPVELGTPPQKTYLNLDTGSADLWTFSSDTYEPQIRGHTLYRPENSKTSERMSGQSWNIKYGDGATASGVVYKDRVQIGATFFDKQAIQSAVQVSSAISNDPFASGILGLGVSNANTVRPDQQKTYLDNIKDKLEKPLFTANLKKQQPGTYNFGYIDEKEHTGDITYRDVRKDSIYWEHGIDGYQIGDGEYKKEEWNTIVDTGTTLLLVPERINKDYYSKVKGSEMSDMEGMWVFPCDAKMPDFTFRLGDYKGVIPGQYINFGRFNNTFCYGGMQSSDDIPFGVAGDVLIKAQFVVFDLGEKRVGYANKRTA